MPPPPPAKICDAFLVAHTRMGYTMGFPVVGDDGVKNVTAARIDSIVKQWFGGSDEEANNKYPLHATILYHSSGPTTATFLYVMKMLALKKERFQGTITDVRTGGPENDLVLVMFEMDDLCKFAVRAKAFLEEFGEGTSEMKLFFGNGLGGISPHMTIAHYPGRPKDAFDAVVKFKHSRAWEVLEGEKVAVVECHVA